MLKDENEFGDVVLFEEIEIEVIEQEEGRIDRIEVPPKEVMVLELELRELVADFVA